MAAGKLRLGVIACGVMEWNLRHVAESSANEFRFVFLPGGLHGNPARLREEVQRAIDAMEEEWRPDGIIIGYGLCGRGLAHIAARHAPLAVPRCEDCTAVFLGSQMRYREQFTSYPGTRYFSCGWIRGYGKERFGTKRNRSLYDPRFEALKDEYGEENARFVVDFRASWKGNYQRAAYIRFDGDPAYSEHGPRVRALAEAEDWRYEELDGSDELFTCLASGRWNHPDILVVNPGEVIIPAPGIEVMSAGTDSIANYRKHLSRFGGHAECKLASRSGLGLGIDAGGTFTDTVVYDLESQTVLDKAKATTTHDDLAAGIRESIARLDAGLVRKVRRVALSTTLATNAIVEGKGQRVGLILMGIGETDVARVQFDLKRVIPGKLSMEGEELAPPDIEAARGAVRRMVEQGARAFAVSGYAATVDPRHEIAVAQAIREETGLPVVCGHELTRQLNIYHRANTAGLNARLLPLIHELIGSVRDVLGEYGLADVRLMVVRGDGTQLLDRSAELVPVETILSGPAASVVGAVTLSGRRDAVVADMGGTTLDIAQVRDREARLDDLGACVGEFHTSVRAMRINTVGLGCDSEVRLCDWPELQVGPRRVLPLTLLAVEHEDIVQQLGAMTEQELENADRWEPTTFLMRRGRECPDGLGERECATLAALEGKPACLSEVARRTGVASVEFVPVAQLEKLGLIQRAGLTPTDLLHVEGVFTSYNVDAAKAAFDYYAACFGITRKELCRRLWRTVHKGIVREVLRSELEDSGAWNPDESSARLVLDHMFANDQADAVFSARLTRPLIPIGAPVHAFFPQLAEVLGAEVVLPEHVEVANAVGAIAARVALSEQVEVSAASDGAFQVESRVHCRKFFRFKDAVDDAEKIVRESLAVQARDNEVEFHEPEFIVTERTSMTNLGPLFLGVRLTGRLRI